MEPLLEVSGLSVELDGPGGRARPLRGVDLTIRPGEAVGLIGESGSGKTLTALSILRLLPDRPSVRGRILWRGRDLLGASERELRRLRGAEIGIVFQDPLSSLHPWYRVTDQIAEAVRAHRSDVSRTAARRRARTLLERVGVPPRHAERHPYPHQWSGGMRQRAMLAMALCHGPGLLIADEPTTALDVTVQAQILELLKAAVASTGAAALLISHDLAVVSELAERVAVMEGGRIVEDRPLRELFAAPERPETRELLRARLPDAERPAHAPAEAGTAPVLRVHGLVVEHRGDGGAPVRAVDGVSLEVGRGETLGLVGESGCGKSTLARTLVGLHRPVRGGVRVEGREIPEAEGRELRRLRARIQMVFQDPAASLNPRRTAAEAVAAPLRAHGRLEAAGGRERVLELLGRVGLGAELADRLPHELSGGQRQRIAIARALALEPAVLVLDEPVTALDAPVRARILTLLRRLQADLGLSLLFIAHDLGVVRAVAHRVAVMYLGRIVEEGETRRVFERPAHPYTKALISAIPSPGPDAPDRSEPGGAGGDGGSDAGAGPHAGGRGRIVLEGEPPDPARPPSGCRFRTRCWKARERCAAEDPRLPPGRGHRHACFFPEEDVPGP